MRSGTVWREGGEEYGYYDIFLGRSETDWKKDSSSSSDEGDKTNVFSRSEN